MKNLELLNRLLDQNLSDFDGEMKEQNSRPIMKESQQTWNPINPETSEGQKKSKFTPQIMQLQAKAVQPDLTQDFVLQDMRFGMNRQADINSLGRHIRRDAGLPEQLE